MVVIVILAMVSAMATTRWSGLHHGAVATAAVQRLEFLDQHLRQFARSRGRGGELVFDLRRHLVGVQRQHTASEGPTWESLGTGVKISRLRIGAEQPASDQASASFDRLGQSPTYGLELDGPGKRRAWLVFAGVTGQLISCDTEGQWHETFEALAPPSL